MAIDARQTHCHMLPLHCKCLQIFLASRHSVAVALQAITYKAAFFFWWLEEPLFWCPFLFRSLLPTDLTNGRSPRRVGCQFMGTRLSFAHLFIVRIMYSTCGLAVPFKIPKISRKLSFGSCPAIIC